MYTELTITDENKNKLTALTVASDRLVAVLALVYNVHPFGIISSSDVNENPLAMYEEEDRDALAEAYVAYTDNKLPKTDITNLDLVRFMKGYLEQIEDALIQ